MPRWITAVIGGGQQLDGGCGLAHGAVNGLSSTKEWVDRVPTVERRAPTEQPHCSVSVP